MKKLKQYLVDAGLQQDAFAKQIKVPPSTISRLVRGLHLPSLPLAVAIERATAGKVRCEDWLK